MITYTWEIKGLDCNITEVTMPKVIEVIHWEYIGTDENGVTINAIGSDVLLPPLEEDFMPFESITKEILINWVEASKDMETIRNYISNKIELINNPKIVTLQLE